MRDSSWLGSTTSPDLPWSAEGTVWLSDSSGHGRVFPGVVSCSIAASLSLSFAYPKVGLPFVNGNDPNLKFLLMIPSGLVGHVRARPPCFQLVNLPQRRQSADPFAISFPLQGLWQCWREPSWRHLWLTSASRWAAHQLAPTAPTFQWNSSTSLHVDWQVQAGVAQNAGEAIQKLG